MEAAVCEEWNPSTPLSTTPQSSLMPSAGMSVQHLTLRACEARELCNQGCWPKTNPEKLDNSKYRTAPSLPGLAHPSSGSLCRLPVILEVATEPGGQVTGYT